MNYQNTSMFDNFMPHGMCYMWRPDILWLHVFSDVAIALSYFVIPFALLYFIRKRAEVPFPGVMYMFSLFITACGVTHVFSIWVVWTGMYGIQGVIKAFTAVASLVTAAMLYPVIPKLLALRSPGELERANLALQEQVQQRKQSELQSSKLQSDIARLGRITTVGQMATGLAHELNQPLLVISTSTDTAVKQLKNIPANDPVLIDCLGDIQRETQRAGDIIRSLRQFMSKKTSRRTQVDINDLVRQAVQMLSAEIRKSGVEVEVLTSVAPDVGVDSVQISQVLVNLIRNSIEAFADLTPGAAKKVNVETRFDAAQVCVSVSDNGPGIPLGVDPFEPFESNKSDGIGVGLSISREIIETHGGNLTHRTGDSGGAHFEFSLPTEPML